MRAPTADDREDVLGRLASLGFPLGADGDAAAARTSWCRRLVDDGTLERNAITEKLMAGAPIEAIAAASGIDTMRVLHHLGRRAGYETAEHNPWRVVPDPDQE